MDIFAFVLVTFIIENKSFLKGKQNLSNCSQLHVIKVGYNKRVVVVACSWNAGCVPVNIRNTAV